MSEDFRDKLISATHVDGFKEPEKGDQRAKAAKNQQRPVYELNTKQQNRPEGVRPKNYSVREEYINSLKRVKGLPIEE